MNSWLIARRCSRGWLSCWHSIASSRGPSAADRVVAFDVLTIIAITAIVLVALTERRAIYLDVALIYALLSFLGVIVVARYLERGL